MKFKTCHFTAALCGILVAHPAFTQGYLVPNGVSFLGYSTAFNGYEFHVLQNPTNSNYTGFFLMPQDIDTFQIAHFADEGVRVFFVAANDPVALEAIQANNYGEHLNVADLADGVPFYLGLYTSDQFPQNGVYPNPMFGWAQLVNNAGAIDFLGGALAYGADGIYAGTQTIIQPVPEPSAFSVTALSLLAMGWRLHFKRVGK